MLLLIQSALLVILVILERLRSLTVRPTLVGFLVRACIDGFKALLLRRDAICALYSSVASAGGSKNDAVLIALFGFEVADSDGVFTVYFYTYS